MKTMLVITNLDVNDKRYKRFVKLLKRSKSEILELYPGAWFVKSTSKPDYISPRLDSLMESEGECVLVTTVGPDSEHMNGWLKDNEAWEFARR